MRLFVESDETGASTLKKTWQDSRRPGKIHSDWGQGPLSKLFL